MDRVVNKSNLNPNHVYSHSYAWQYFQFIFALRLGHYGRNLRVVKLFLRNKQTGNILHATTCFIIIIIILLLLLFIKTANGV
jgi:hypothetical protein